jgi:hypothetical protein
MAPPEKEGKFPIGVFANKPSKELTKVYDELLAKAAEGGRG